MQKSISNQAKLPGKRKVGHQVTRNPACSNAALCNKFSCFWFLPFQIFSLSSLSQNPHCPKLVQCSLLFRCSARRLFLALYVHLLRFPSLFLPDLPPPKAPPFLLQFSLSFQLSRSLSPQVFAPSRLAAFQTLFHFFSTQPP